MPEPEGKPFAPPEEVSKSRIHGAVPPGTVYDGTCDDCLDAQITTRTVSEIKPAEIKPAEITTPEFLEHSGVATSQEVEASAFFLGYVASASEGTQASNTLRVWREDPRAKLPTRSHPTDSGLDLYAIETLTLRPGQRHMVDTGLKIALPTGHEGQIRPRSGLAAKHGITIVNAPGTIDEHYRGRCKVILLNTSQENFLIQEGITRIAQLVIAPIARFDPVEVKDGNTLGDTDRGEGGFGSTGN